MRPEAHGSGRALRELITVVFTVSCELMSPVAAALRDLAFKAAATATAREPACSCPPRVLLLPCHLVLKTAVSPRELIARHHAPRTSRRRAVSASKLSYGRRRLALRRASSSLSLRCTSSSPPACCWVLCVVTFMTSNAVLHAAPELAVVACRHARPSSL
jgi:hypothetical protein